jgi:hypothetical protein
MPQPGEITADPSLEQAKKTSAAFKALVQHGHQHHGPSVREDHYKGHHIVIRTTYEIEIDGRPFHGTLDVSNAGMVQYHGIPNVSANSAVELIRSVIDAFPDDFAGGGGHEHEHAHPGHGTHAARTTTKARRRAKARKATKTTKKAGKTAKKKGSRHAGSRKHPR